MRLTPNSVLNLAGATRRTRLSYVFADDDGSATGVTSSWLASTEAAWFPPPGEVQGDRTSVFVGKDEVGKLNPLRRRDGDDGPDETATGTGVLTRSFLLAPGVAFRDEFKSQSTGRLQPLHSVGGEDAYLLGEDDLVGRISPELEYTPVGDRLAYPLLCLKRLPEDLKRIGLPIRSGAMAVTGKGGLIGVVIGISDDKTVYSVAPIFDVLKWHGLDFFGEEREVSVEGSFVFESKPMGGLPKQLDPHLERLIGS